MDRLAILSGSKTRTRPFSPWPQYSESDRARLMQVLDSRNWGGYPFPNTLAQDFAGKFAAYHGAKYGCCLANGTVAITVALKAAGIRFGDEVIVPAYTWDGTARAVLDAGAIPIFADIDPDSYCLSVEAARSAIGPRTRCLLPVHLAMRFADMDGLLALATERNLAVIEDCAHVHGGEYGGRGAGSMGDIGCFSLQASKLMTAGEGGIAITSRLDCFELIQSLVNCGRASVTDEYKQRVTGGNYRITEFQAAILLGQLETLPELSARRARNAMRLTAALTAIEGISPLPAQPLATREAIYNYVFRYRAASGVSRDLFVAALNAEGIPSDGRFYEPVYRSDLYHPTAVEYPQLVDYRSFHCPVAERAAYDESVWLPQFLLLGDEDDVKDIAAAVGKIMANRDALRRADPDLARVQSMSRADRPRIEKQRNY